MRDFIIFACINSILQLIRWIRFDFDGFLPCVLENGKRIDMWDLKPGDVFRMDPKDEKLIVVDWPVVCWLEGNWGVMSIPEDEYSEFKIQEMGL